MNSKISERIQNQRKSIRRTQILQFFSVRRDLMKCILKEDALAEITAHLNRLKAFTIHQENFSQALYALRQIRKIIKNHDILDQLICKIELKQSLLSLMRFNVGYQELTWIDIFSLLLKQYREELDLGEQCSYILNQCVVDLKSRLVKMNSIQNESVFLRQYKRLLQSYPYELILHSNTQIVQCSLCFIYNIMSSVCDNGPTIYFLLNKINPNIVSLLNSLIQNKQILSISSVRKEVLNTAIIIVYYIQLYNYNKLEVGELTCLVNQIKQLLFQSFQHHQNQEQFVKACAYLRILSNSPFFVMEKHEFQPIEALFQVQVKQKNVFYLSLVKSLVSKYTFTLSPQNIDFLCCTLFCLNDGSSHDLNVKQFLIDIMQDQLINSGNHLNEENQISFTSCWGEYSKADRLLGLIELLDEQQLSKKALKRLFGLVVQTLVDASLIQNLTFVFESDLEKLCEYELFLEVLHANKMSLQW